MKKIIKTCSIVGLVLLISGIVLTTVSIAVGGSMPKSPIAFTLDRWLMGHNNIPKNPIAFTLDRLLMGRDNRHEEISWHETAAPDPDRFVSDPASSGSDHSIQPSPDSETYTFPVSRELELDIDKGEVLVTASPDVSEITVIIEDDADKTQCYMDKDTLKIRRESRRMGAVSSALDENGPYISVYVPTEHHFEKVDLEAGVASCNLKRILTSKLDMETGVGAAAFYGTVTGDINVESGVGAAALYLTGDQSDYNYKIECGPGTIRVGSDQYTMLDDDKEIKNGAPYSMDLECGVGTIDVYFNTEL